MPGLDEVLEGGYPRDRLFLIQGDPGVGKTTLALQFLLEGQRLGERGLYITLAETRDELESVAVSHAWSFDGIEIFEQRFEDELGLGGDNTLFHPAEVELAETTREILDKVERANPDRVVIDSLSELRLLAQSGLRYRRQILALKQYFAGRHSTVLLLDDRTSETGDLQLQSIAHGVISMDQLVPLYGGDRRRLRAVKMRGVPIRGGYHDFKIEAAGIRVFPRLIAAEHRDQFQPGSLPSGTEGLDALVGGGLPYGSSTLRLGPPGAGKSVLAMTYAVAAARRGENAVVFEFDESLHIALARANGLGLGIDGHRGKVRLQQIDPAEMAPGEFVHQVRTAVAEEHARVVIIDSLNGYMNAMPEEQFLILQLHELLSHLGQQGVITILVVAQHGLLTSMQSPIDVSYLADTVLMFRHFETGGRLHKAISVLKKRTGNHESTIRELTIGPKSVTVGPALERFHGILTGTPRFVQPMDGPLGGAGDD
ncbi:MAG: ATPase domain-containing protein [Candidatus Limnocylindrales bacterium]